MWFRASRNGLPLVEEAESSTVSCESFRSSIARRVDEILVKRLFDIVAALAMIALSAPLLLGAALIIVLFSGRPVFFRHQRVGRWGQSFHCLKFRTMVPGAEEWLSEDEQLLAEHRKNGFKLPLGKDPRVTKVGHFLRRTQLDELPQLWNVVVGDMSLVGPRPLVEEELFWFDGGSAEQLLSVRPGIFGPWTALGRRRPGYPERADVDLGYVGRVSLLGDLGLLLAHIPVLLQGQSDES